ncbi:MAG: YkgJ family cysteine cluster protein [Byssovorax sp.]
MSAYEITRPIWRKFRPKFLKRAAEHVRAGGCAVIEPEEGRMDMILTVDGKGPKAKITELGLWALLALNHRRWRRVQEGPAKGLATARVPKDYEGSVIDWCDRDAVHEGPTRTIKLDCLECGACCHDANVLLDHDDFNRWKKGGRGDLIHKSYIKRGKDGKVTLRFAESGDCQHLGRDKKCAIYTIRPDNCRAFVVGSEACLAAREDTLRLRDG